MSFLTFEKVGLTYEKADGQNFEALSCVSLEVQRGESIAIIGPSGCGKSSLLRLAAGLQKPSQGSVCVDGAALGGPRLGTALILQDFGLLPWKNVYKNAELGLLVRKVEAAERRTRTMAALEQVGLAAFAQSYPSELSGGMQQRLALARALTLDADLFLLDEPLSALDALLRDNLQSVLLDLWQARHYTQILVTHSLEEAVFLGQRIVVMGTHPGRIVAVIENPSMGSADYKTSEEYFAQCKMVREALMRACAAEAETCAEDCEEAGVEARAKESSGKRVETCGEECVETCSGKRVETCAEDCEEAGEARA